MKFLKHWPFLLYAFLAVVFFVTVPTNYNMDLETAQTASWFGGRLRVTDSLSNSVKGDATRPVSDFDDDINMGLTKHIKKYQQIGRNDTITGLEDIWNIDASFQWPITNERFEAVNVDADDTLNGSGAWNVRIIALDTGFMEYIDTINIPNDSSKFLSRRLLFAEVLNTGSYGATNEGNIIIRNNKSSDTLAVIEAGQGRAYLSNFTTPANAIGYVEEINGYVSSNDTCDLYLYKRPMADVTGAGSGAVIMLDAYDDISGQINIPLEGWLTIPPKSDIWFRGQSGNASMNVNYTVYLRYQ